MKKKLYLMLGSILVAAVWILALTAEQRSRTIAGSVMSEQEQAKLEASLDFERDLDFQLIFHQGEVPYDSETDTYYLPQREDGTWILEESFTFTEDGLSLYWYADPYLKEPERAIAEGHVFSFLVTDGSVGRNGKIIFTGLPMMQLQTIETMDEEQSYCKVRVLDPFHSGGAVYEITECYGSLSLRGKTSKSFPKKGWNLELLKESGESFKTDLFGLRVDDDWKLNALYPDATKVRETVCMELWNELAAQTQSSQDAGTRMEYFELVIDNEYMGLYGAMEQLDYKQFSLDASEDVIYKGYAWPQEGNIDENTLDTAGDFCGHMIKTGEREISADLWQPFVEYAKAANFAENQENCNPETFYEYMKLHMDPDNFLNLEIYIQTLYAFDNKYKNLYIAADITNEGDYTLWRIPWDLNYSFGDRFSAEDPALTKYNLEWAEELMPQFMLSETLLESGNTEFTVSLQKKWDYLKCTVLSLDNVRKLAEEQMEILTSSGAFERDAKKWPEGPHDPSLEPILEFHERRLEFLDSHYHSYGD